MDRQVLGLKAPLLQTVWCLILSLPPGNTNVLVPEFPVPPSLTPPAVNAPVAMVLDLLAVAEVAMIWKCSVPEMAGLALAAARPVPPAVAATAAARAAPVMTATALLIFFRFPLLSCAPGGAAAGRAWLGRNWLSLMSVPLARCGSARDAPPEEIAAAVRIVAGGDALLAPAITRAVIEEFARQPLTAAPAPSPAVAELTPREREVLDLLTRGRSNPEICAQLVISDATAKTHVARILQKLGLRDRIQTVIYAYETGLIAPGMTAAGDQPAG